jgi:HAD superfamily hydrolase (TIGR01549 family)
LKTVDCLVFDLDGTLIDSSEGVVDAVNYSLRMMDCPEQPPERIKRYIGFPLSQMYPDFTDAPVPELYRHFQVRAAETVVSSTVALDRVPEALSLLRKQGFRMAIASTKVRRHIEGIVARLEWAGYFDALVGGDDVTRVKPAPDAFNRALHLLEASPKRAIAIGDTINDIEAARAVPMPVVGVTSPYRERTELEQACPDYLITSLSDLPSLLQRINR